MDREAEVAHKLEHVRAIMHQSGLTGMLFRGTDWFAWITAGGSNAVLLAADTGVAEVLVTTDGAWVLTDEIEARRLREEELPRAFELHVHPWADREARGRFVQDATEDGRVASDRPREVEDPLPEAVVRLKRRLLLSEIERYRRVGRLAAEAMTEALSHARPDWTELRLAGAGAEALWSRGLDPALILVAGARRGLIHRHPRPTGEPLGPVAMMVFCARGAGLYANLTRFVSFGPLDAERAGRHAALREIEAVGLEASRAGAMLKDVYIALEKAYIQHEQLDAIREHHQGGTTGYLSRELVAGPESTDLIADYTAVAWNPSLPGAKIEDTFLVADGGHENLTFDPNWPSVRVHGRSRPIPWETP